MTPTASSTPTCELRLRHDPTAQQPVAAWLLPGSEPLDWLQEIVSWDISQSVLRLWLIPTSPSQPLPLGVLVTVDGASKHGGRESDQLPVRVAPWCQPYACIAANVFVPVAASIEPSVTEAELVSLLGTGSRRLCVWHPTAGLVGIETNTALRVSDLLLPPGACRGTLWDQADPGTVLNQRLHSLEPEFVPDLNQLIALSRGDIGEDADDRQQLPRTKSEPTPSSLGSLSQLPMLGLAHAIRWLTQFSPRTASAPTWVNHVEDWASRKLQGLIPDFVSARHRELERLLGLLDSDPDQGLRFALPLGSEKHRGVAPPGSRLGERDVNFQLSHFGGGQAADAWDVPPEVHVRLQARYRELANRELRLGRHRRAAYIFAELMGDFSSAANVLAEGSFFREAAVIYREKLHNHRAAAECLERGGYWQEAIDGFTQLGHFERVGDLNRRIGEHEHATVAYRTAVDERLSRDDRLAAAKILEGKLELPTEAAQVLRDGWPDSTQHAVCLRALFELHGRHAQHAQVQHLLIDLQQHASLQPRRQQLTLTELLSNLPASYPDRTTATQAADVTRVLAARLLALESPSDAARIVAAVSRLVPQDRLLQRDGQRFLKSIEPPKRTLPTAKQKTAPSHGSVELIESIKLRSDILWEKAVASGSFVFVAGRNNHLVVLAMVSWDFSGQAQTTQYLEWPCQAIRAGSLQLAVDPETPKDITLVVDGQASLRTQWFSTMYSKTPIFAWTPEFLSGWPDSVAQLGDTLFAVDEIEGCFGLCTYSKRSLLNVRTMPSTSLQPQVDARYSMIARRGGVYLAMGNVLTAFWLNDRTTSQAFSEPIAGVPEPIIHMAASCPLSRTRLLLSFEQSCVLLWPHNDERVTFATDLVRPVAGFTRGDAVIAADATQIEVSQIRDGSVWHIKTLPRRGAPPIAVLTLAHKHRFALCSVDGLIQIYEGKN